MVIVCMEKSSSFNASLSNSLNSSTFSNESDCNNSQVNYNKIELLTKYKSIVKLDRKKWYSGVKKSRASCSVLLLTAA